MSGTANEPCLQSGVKPPPRADPAAAGAAAATQMSDATVTDLLARLSSGRADAAWREFLDQYSPLIKRVIQRHHADYGQAAECFTHVCGELSDGGFRRLLAFRPDGPAQFTTWLMAVVSNLCVDWRRKMLGRVRPPPHVARLPELDQQVFRCIFVRGMSRRQCVETLLPRFPELSEYTVSAINARLFASLTPQQRWQLTVRPPVLQPVALGSESRDDNPVSRVATSEPGPDDLAAELQERQRLLAALAQLPAGQRLLLRLRFEQGLTLAEVARLTGQPDPFRVNRQVQAALDALAGLIAGLHGAPARKSR